MFEDLTASTWVNINDGCPMTCDVHGSGKATVEFGEKQTTVELQFESEALRRFVELATDALRDMDERYTREQPATTATAPTDGPCHALAMARPDQCQP